MDKSTVGGMIGVIVVIIGSILIAPGAKLSAFVDYPSLVCVVGGGVAATLLAFPLKSFLIIHKVILKAVMPKPPIMAPAIRTIVECAEIARRDGVLALENKVQDIEDPFILLGIQMAVDGSDSELIETVLRTEMQTMSSRHKAGKLLMDTLGRYSPAFGMIGTLLGLIIMLGNMDDPAAIGPGMAVALLTTLYGAVFSNCFALPFADKLAFYSRREMEVREVIVQGILAIQNGDNPRVVEQKLATFLPKADRASLNKAA